MSHVNDVNVKTIGVKEFRENLAEHLMSHDPIAVTKHGLTVGYYLPTHKPVSKDSLQELAALSETLQSLLDAHNIDSEELIKEAQALRRKNRHNKSRQ